MKYLLLTSMTALMLFGCSNNNQATQDSDTAASQAIVLEDVSVVSQADTATQQQVLHFTGPNDLTIELKSNDNFSTATMTDNSDRSFELKSAVAASGLKLANDDGVSIHFKQGDGVVEFVKGTPISITEFKSDKTH